MDILSKNIEPQQLEQYIYKMSDFMSVRNQRYCKMLTALMMSEIRDAVIVLSPRKMESLLRDLGLSDRYDWLQIGHKIALQRGRNLLS
jgi:hypothetical protein